MAMLPYLKKMHFILAGVMFLGFFLSACYVDYGMTTEDYDVVTTLRDPNFDFSKLATYSLPDTIFHITDDDGKSDLSREYDQFIIDRVTSNMELAGFRRIADPTQELPDVLLVLRAVSSTNYVGYTSYYWGGYWGWPGWGGYYPWYGGTTVYQYSTGTLLMDLQDVKGGDVPNLEFPIVWGAGINGLLGDTGTNTRRRLQNNIDQAFIQSPYIGSGSE